MGDNAGYIYGQMAMYAVLRRPLHNRQTVGGDMKNIIVHT